MDVACDFKPLYMFLVKVVQGTIKVNVEVIVNVSGKGFFMFFHWLSSFSMIP